MLGNLLKGNVEGSKQLKMEQNISWEQTREVENKNKGRKINVGGVKVKKIFP